MKLELCHADTCLADYWSGHHLATLQVPVWRGMTFWMLKDALAHELLEGAIGGNGEMADILSGVGSVEEVDAAHTAAHEAIDRMTLNNPAENPDDTELFLDLPEEDPDDDAESVYAFFVFREIDDD